MNRLIFLLLFFLLACGNEQSAPPAEQEGLPENAQVVSYENDPSLKVVKISGTSGELTAEGTQLDDARAGSWIEYYPSGKTKSITSYVDGKKEGPYVELADNNGQLIIKAWYHNDLLHGDYTVYNYGVVKESRHYEEGKLEGVLKKYYDTGTIMEESNYRNGTMDGDAKWYDQEGNVTIEYQYKEGKLVKK